MKKLIFFILILANFCGWAARANDTDVEDTIVAADGQSTTHILKLRIKNLPDILAIKRVSNVQNTKPMATILLLNGLITGMNSAKLFVPPAGTMVVSLDYKIPEKMNELGERALYAATQLPNIEASITATLLWLAQQKDVDAKRLSVVAVSFGTFVTPMSLRAVEFLGVQPATTIFIHGGARLRNFVERYERENPSKKPADWARDTVERALDFIDPIQHLKFLRGPFLVITASGDQIIPPESSAALVANLPEPKTVLEMNSGHVDSDQPEVIAKVLDTVTTWMREHGAIP